MEFSDVVRARRSIRAFAPRRPPHDLIDALVDTARRAPTAGFSQGIDFLVIDAPTELEAFWALTAEPEASSAPVIDETPPIVVLVLSDPETYILRYSADDKIEFGLDDRDAWPVRFWDVDAGMAAMQLQLAAVDAGLATWFFGIAHGEQDLRDRWGVPENREIVGVIALGYRSEGEVAVGSATTRRRRPLEEQLHRNSW
jgi:nitroreductase